MTNIFTKDVLFEIMLRSDDNNIKNFSLLNKSTYKIFVEDYLWKTKTIISFGKDCIKYKTYDESWKDYYFILKFNYENKILKDLLIIIQNYIENEDKVLKLRTNTSWVWGTKRNGLYDMVYDLIVQYVHYRNETPEILNCDIELTVTKHFHIEIENEDDKQFSFPISDTTNCEIIFNTFRREIIFDNKNLIINLV